MRNASSEASPTSASGLSSPTSPRTEKPTAIIAPHGDMALSYALRYIETQKLAQLTVYADFLEKHPPTHEVEIVENTSWSCVHGIERWRSNCGCNSGRAGMESGMARPFAPGVRLAARHAHAEI